MTRGASPGLVASPQPATGASARRLTKNQQAGPKSAASETGRGGGRYCARPACVVTIAWDHCPELMYLQGVVNSRDNGLSLL